jgi:hypothetical protein
METIIVQSSFNDSSNSKSAISLLDKHNILDKSQFGFGKMAVKYTGRVKTTGIM